MGDLLASPHVALLFLLFRFSYSVSPFTAFNIQASLACSTLGDPREWQTALLFTSLVEASEHLK